MRALPLSAGLLATLRNLERKYRGHEIDWVNIADARRNLADSLSLGFTYTSRLADLLEPAFAARTAAEWERFLAANGTAATIMMTWEEWQHDADARTAGVFAEVPGTVGVQIGRVNWMRSAHLLRRK